MSKKKPKSAFDYMPKFGEPPVQPLKPTDIVRHVGAIILILLSITAIVMFIWLILWFLSL